eukprot:Nk52_evm14s230 gene=Nk52_evmTU14s230
MGVRNIIIEDSPFKRNAKKSSPALYYLLSNFTNLFLIVLAIYPVILCIVAPIVWVELSKSMAQNSIDATTLDFTNIQLGPIDYLKTDNQTDYYLTVKANANMALAGASPITINPSNLEVRDGLLIGKSVHKLSQTLQDAAFASGIKPGDSVAEIKFPIMELEPEVAKEFQFDSKLFAYKNGAMATIWNRMFQGEVSIWNFNSAVSLLTNMGISLNFEVMWSEDVAFPAVGLNDIKIGNLVLNDSTTTSLSGTTTLSINNPSSVDMPGLGDMKFNLRQYETGEVFGTLAVPDVSLRKGNNVFPNTAIEIKQTFSSLDSVQFFLSNWTSGMPQKFYISGPTESVGGIFNFGFGNLTAEFESNPEANKTTAYFELKQYSSAEADFDFYPNDFVDMKVNPYGNITATYSEFVSNLRLHDPVAFRTKNGTECPADIRIPSIGNNKNRYALPGGSNSNVEVALEVVPPTTGFESASHDYNYCTILRTMAACCIALGKEQGTPSSVSFNVESDSRMLALLGEFTSAIEYGYPEKEFRCLGGSNLKMACDSAFETVCERSSGQCPPTGE